MESVRLKSCTSEQLSGGNVIQFNPLNTSSDGVSMPLSSMPFSEVLSYFQCENC